MLRGGIEVDAYEVHATLNGLVQRVLELGLVNVVLILSNADALGVNLHQFRQRVHQSSSDAHGTAHRDVLVREFVAGYLRSTIDRSAVFADDEDCGLLAFGYWLLANS